MGFLSRVTGVTDRMEMRAIGQNWDAFDDRWYDAHSWVSKLSASGVAVTPELAMTLSAMYGGVTTIAYDLATLPCQVFKYRQDGGKDRVRGGSFSAGTGGISHLVYMLRWQPNNTQTAAEFVMSCVAQFLLRGKAFVELTTAPQSGFLDQMLPRHPDRIETQRLANGRLRYKLTEANGEPRYLTQDEMLVVRDLTMNGLDGEWSRIDYAAQSLGTALAAERAAAKFFKSGMTASVVATYEGDMDEEEEKKLHGSITRYATGVENTFGLMLIPDNVTVSNLGISPEKAQMMLAREWTVREVARILRLPGYKLGIQNATSYASQVQAALEYVINCLRPIAVIFEQAYQRDLILAKDDYFVEFKLEGLMRGDPQARAAFYQSGITSRWMRPSEARLLENMNPDPKLDELSEADHRPGSAGGSDNQPRPNFPQQQQPSEQNGALSRASLKAVMAMHDNAMRCLRRERAAVEKLAKKYEDDPDGWSRALRSFFSDHAGFIAETMRLHPAVARGVAAQRGSELEMKGTQVYGDEGWERFEADDLTSLALCEGNTIDAWFERRLVDTRPAPPITVHSHTPVHIDRGAVQVDARHESVVHSHVEPGAVAVTVEPPQIEQHLHHEFKGGDVHIAKGAVQVDVPTPAPVERVTEIERDANNLITRQRTRDVPVKE